ncbi:hypothetical protein [Planococcus salinus]|uniref:Uncharacterized protein n=1 Tax=Planococcus salinus TaxID=1848460 RepID=A0A3M8P7B5_9BACL|nr:hypothetical protein [Planococcus salinus]RNF39567.1 hypothetical protein EEX84_08820 [Planococcus salinus]
MTRKGTEGRSPQKNIGANESAIDKAVKKTKDAVGGDNEEVKYNDEEVDTFSSSDEYKGEQGKRVASAEPGEKVAESRETDEERTTRDDDKI